MNRIDRLELVVRRLADRILGEQITFDAIAKEEAAEQGLVYEPPVPSAPPPEVPDLSPVLEAIDNLAGRVAALEKQHSAQEAAMQRMLQILEDHAATLEIITSIKVFDKDAVLGSLKAG